MTKSKSKFNDEKYNRGIRLVVEQLALMIAEDECDDYEASDYLADLYRDISDRLLEYRK